MTVKKLEAVAQCAAELTAKLEAAQVLLEREPAVAGPARDRVRAEVLALVTETAKGTDAMLADLQAIAAPVLH